MPASAAPALADRANAVQDKFAKIMACALIVMMAYCALNPDQATINKGLIALAVLAVLGLAAAIVIEARPVKNSTRL
jgi:ABC-type transport system involved in cytochrome bd biosynthesis fused ATPase/permease subunit